jgi:Protein of unknown function (DUF3071)
MRELRLVAISDDGTYLVLRANGDETPMSLPLDERLHAAIRGDRARLGQLEIQMDSQLRPRDIQARVRSGESVQSVAAAAGVPLDKVLRFAGPVLAEREHIADRAQQAIIRRAGNDTPNRPLRESVAEWVSSYDVDPETIGWDAWRRDDGKWVVCARWQVQQVDREATFTFDPTGRSVVPDNEEARAVAGERVPEPAAPAAEPPAVPGPARLSVVADAGDNLDEPSGEPDERSQPVEAEPVVTAEADDYDDEYEESDDQPTVPVPLAGPRPPRPADPRRLRNERRRQGSRPSEERTDPWARDEPSSDRLRLADIASKIEVEGDEPASDDRVAASVPAAGGDVAPEPEYHRPRPKRSSARSKRPSVPSWDEIMFGRRDRNE